MRARIADGAVRGFATNGQVNGEAVLAAQPSVLLSQGVDDPAFPALRAGGVPVIGWAEYLETGPLGQAEWIKVMGALTGHEVDAARVYDDIARRYADIRATGRGGHPRTRAAGRGLPGHLGGPGRCRYRGHADPRRRRHLVAGDQPGQRAR